LVKSLGTGLPNPNFKNQEFFPKKPGVGQETFDTNQEKNQEIFIDIVK